MSEDGGDYDWVSDAIEGQAEEETGEDDRTETDADDGFQSIESEPIESQSTDNVHNESRIDDDTIELLQNVSSSPTVKEIKTLQKNLAHEKSDLSDIIMPIIEFAINSADNHAQKEEDFNRVTAKIENLAESIESQTETEFTGTPISKVSEINDEINNGGISIQKSSDSISRAASNVKNRTNFSTSRSKRFISNLINPNKSDINEELILTVEDLDEIARIRKSIDDITDRDIQRRINSVEQDLSNRDSLLSQQLSDRLNQFRQAAKRRDTNEVQQYAIYQELSYYDKTLLPRLSRSDNRF